MKLINYLLCILMLSLMAGCTDPDENEENPDLRVINNFSGYKISNIIVNSQSFKAIDEYLLPGESTDYMNVLPGQSLILAYRWEHMSDTGDHGDFSRLTAIGDYIETTINESYTLSYSGDKEDPTISLVNE